MNFRYYQVLLAAAVCLIAAIGLAALNNQGESAPQAIDDSGLISPPAALSNSTGFDGLPREGVINSRFLPLEKELDATVSAALKQGPITEIGVYFLDLKSGTVISNNSEAKFMPASLLKLPLMMTYFKDAEKDSGVLRKTLTYQPHSLGEFDQQEIPQEARLKEGHHYSVLELITRMIVLSDNRSDIVLFENANRETMSRVFLDHGIELPSSTSERLKLSPRDYSTFFYVLYKNQYLTPEYSEKALEILKQTTFGGGLTAKLPPEIPVANKFGERINKDGNQLHDCGIVYYPDNPYLLCVMTNGKSIPEQSKTIGDISYLFFSHFKANQASVVSPQ